MLVLMYILLLNFWEQAFLFMQQKSWLRPSVQPLYIQLQKFLNLSGGIFSRCHIAKQTSVCHASRVHENVSFIYSSVSPFTNLTQFIIKTLYAKCFTRTQGYSSEREPVLAIFSKGFQSSMLLAGVTSSEMIKCQKFRYSYIGEHLRMTLKQQKNISGPLK